MLREVELFMQLSCDWPHYGSCPSVRPSVHPVWEPKSETKIYAYIRQKEVKWPVHTNDADETQLKL